MLQPKLWIFGSGNGQTYADNSRALFEHINAQEPGVRAVWLTSSPRLLAAIREQGYEAYLMNSAKGRWLALTAKVVVISNSFLDVGVPSYAWLPRRKKIIQLWHGTPLKVLENKVWSIKQKLLIHTFLAYIGRDCDMVISATPLNEAAYIRNFRVDKKAIKITGQPRNDWLFKKQPSGIRRIWYIPTFRDYDEHYDFFGPNGFDPQAVNDFLTAHDAELHLKLHHVDKQKFATYFESFKNLSNIFISDPENLYTALGAADILLTDYSSVYFDFLLTGRPVIFTPFDYTQYKKDRDFYYEYDDVTPGPKARNWTEVITHLQDILAGKDLYDKQRRAINDTFNTFQDDKSSQRVAKVIKDIL